jgi:putative hydrolase of the HAD superfamily
VIRAVILDLGRVLIPFDFTIGYQKMGERCGLPPEQVRARLHASQLVHPFESGLIGPAEFAARVCESLGAEIPYGEFAEIWFSIFLPEPLIPEDFVARLRRRYRTVLLSNTNEMHFTLLRERYPILGHFDAYSLSYMVKAQKPDPRIYEHAIASAGCRAEECFYTDDVPSYVEGGRAAGLRAYHFEGFEKLKADLREAGADGLQ